jgi:small-conductance mechanosensitive channel
MQDLLTRMYFGNSLQSWVWAVGAFLGTFLLLPLLRRSILAHRTRVAQLKAPAGVDLVLTLIERTSGLFLWAVALYVGERFLDLPPRVERASTVLIVLVFWFQAALWGSAAVRFALERQSQLAVNQGDAAMRGSLGVILFVARLVIFVVAVLLALDNLGVNITALVAGLGIGGIAIALAVQTVLGDLFASLSITLDKPFMVGDLLRIDDVEGSVERIGIKSTRLRSVTGEQIIVSNADLLKSRVRNLGRMAERRVLFTLALRHDTPPAKLEQVPQLVRAVVQAQADTRFEHCALNALGESALQYQVCYFVSMQTPGRLLAVTDAVNRGILAALAREDIRFAGAPRAVLLEREAG